MKSHLADIDISEALVRKFDNSGPRYTSYPTADRFHAGFNAETYQTYLDERAGRPENPPLSIYVHLPFCESLCYFCACNKIITKDHARVAEYLRYLDKEMALVAQRLAKTAKPCNCTWAAAPPPSSMQTSCASSWPCCAAISPLRMMQSWG